MIIRHNSIRDLFAELISEICKDVVTEPPLLPLTGETLPAGSNLSDGARLDTSCRNLWSPLAIFLLNLLIILHYRCNNNWPLAAGITYFYFNTHVVISVKIQIIKVPNSN